MLVDAYRGVTRGRPQLAGLNRSRSVPPPADLAVILTVGALAIPPLRFRGVAPLLVSVNSQLMKNLAEISLEGGNFLT